MKPRNILDLAALLAVVAALFLLTNGATHIQPEAVPAAPTPTASVNEHRAQTAALRSLAYVDESDETRGMTPEDCDPETVKLIAEAFGEGAYVSSHCKP